MSELNRLDYTEMCIKESLRLYPGSPFIFRKLSRDLQLSKYELEQSSNIQSRFTNNLYFILAQRMVSYPKNRWWVFTFFRYTETPGSGRNRKISIPKDSLPNGSKHNIHFLTFPSALDLATASVKIHKTLNPPTNHFDRLITFFRQRTCNAGDEGTRSPVGSKFSLGTDRFCPRGALEAELRHQTVRSDARQIRTGLKEFFACVSVNFYFTNLVIF